MEPAYSAAQLSSYEEFISLPQRFRLVNKPALTSEYLNSLHVHQISKVPYENLLLHYSKDHAVSLDPQVIFQKTLGNRRGRGGYCMENSIMFNHVLRGLGFKAYLSGARVRPRTNGIPSGDYSGWIHLVNIVTLADGSKYHVDVGFGGDQATKPLPLVSGHSTPNIGTQEIRLVLSNIPQQLDQSQKLWIYEYRNNPEQQWNSFYCFPDTEFLETDFVGVNHFTSTYQGPLNFQTRTVIIVRFLREGEDIVGKIICINDEIKRNMGGKTSLVKICKTEDERVETFKSLFGIDLTEEEREGIKGRNVELLGTKKE